MLAAARSKIPWALVAIEVAAIFLSVFLAFGVTEWRQGRREAMQQHQALESYRSELARNREVVDDKLPYHAAVLDSLRNLGTPPTSTGDLFRQIGWRGPSQSFFTDHAQRTAEATGAIGLIDYDLAGRLTAIYAQQENQRATHRALAEAGFNPALFRDESGHDLARVLETYFTIVVESEQNLLRSYDAVLPRLDRALGRPPAEASRE